MHGGATERGRRERERRKSEFTYEHANFAPILNEVVTDASWCILYSATVIIQKGAL